ncbi:efflux transporter outer membrane subunit [Acidocella sp.]|uniref:efflux transporter outer membrane subunit n=1 Tax=Acidocella sp. TaxID=50710 RepID=UPI003CFFBA2E
MRHVKPASALLLSLLSGCSLIPAYHRPALPVTNQYPVTTSTSGQPAADIGWEQFFKDPALQKLIALSLANNRDLRVSVLDVEEAQAQYRVDRASLFPTIEGNAYQDVTRTPANLSSSGNAVTAHEYSLGAQAVSWELDLFGKIRSKAESARQTYLSDAQTAVSARIALVAEVASEYYAWQADRESLQIAQETAASAQKSLHLTALELSHGTTTAMDVAQAQSTYDTAKADIAQYQRQVAQDLDQLVLLAGAPIPRTLLKQMEDTDGLAAEPALPRVPAGLPSDLLTRRPDIRAAEHLLLAANANIGAARAAFFPSISLTASGGVASNSLSSLFDGGQGSWMFEPQITVPIFTAGANIANLDIAKIEKRIEIANYEKAIQSAFHDVSDALTARQTYDDQVSAQTDLVAADSRYYQLADMRFKAGIDNYLNVLVAQDSLLSARLTLVSLKLVQQQNEITLYKALGGGWQAQSTPPVPTAAGTSANAAGKATSPAPKPVSASSKPIPLTAN